MRKRILPRFHFFDNSAEHVLPKNLPKVTVTTIEKEMRAGAQADIACDRGRCTDRPVRVCFLIDRLCTGGTETQLVTLIQHLDRTRVRPFLCLLDGQDPVSQALEPDSCEVVRLGVRSLLRPRTLLKIRDFSKLLKAWNIDILQVHFPDSTYFGVPAARWASVPIVLRTRRDLFYWVTPVHRRWGRHLDSVYNRFLIDAMIANSRAVRAKTIEDELPAPRHIEVIPNGLDLARFSHVASASRFGNDLRVGIVAMLRPEKRVDLLIRAARQVLSEHPGTRFLIAGEGPERQRLEELVDKLELKANVELKGRVADIPNFLSQLDIGVLCSETEGLSNALMEYMAAGLPVVATAVGGNLELVEHERTGLLTPVGDVHSLSEAIDRLVAHPEEARRMGREGKAYADERFAIEAVTNQYEEFYELLTSKNGIADEHWSRRANSADHTRK